MLKFRLVDSFTRTPLQGNPVAVFLDCAALETSTMQSLAREMNLSESTFVTGIDRDGNASVRIFTPVNELDFAGHPLLGTALVISQQTNKPQFRIKTAKGSFRFSVEMDSNSEHTIAYVQMEQPEPFISSYPFSDDLLICLGLEKSCLPVEMYDVGPRHVLIAVEDEDKLSRLAPDLRRLAKHENIAVLCFCKGNEEWRLRMFSPAYGVAEDAATGSAAGPLALHLARHSWIPFGTEISILQGKEMNRPSFMKAIAEQTDNGEYRLMAGGYAVHVGEGTHVV